MVLTIDIGNTKTKIAVFKGEQLIEHVVIEQINKEYINKLIDKIELFDDEVKIYYNSPINNSPDDNQGFCFYTSKIDEMKIKMLI